MSQVDEFHYHDVVISGDKLSVAYPSGVYDCPEPQCREQRVAIENLTMWSEESLREMIATAESEVARHNARLGRLRGALALKQRQSA